MVRRYFCLEGGAVRGMQGAGRLSPGGGNEVRVLNEGPVKNIRRAFYRSLVENILARSRRKRTELSLAFVSDRTIRRLNRRYRGKDRPTDVLAFDLSRHGSPRGRFRGDRPADRVAEIIISSETARRQAVEAGHPLQRELSVLVIHGLLHTLGYDHEKPADARRMARRERLLARLFLPPIPKRPPKKKGVV